MIDGFRTVRNIFHLLTQLYGIFTRNCNHFLLFSPQVTFQMVIKYFPHSNTNIVFYKIKKTQNIFSDEKN